MWFLEELPPGNWGTLTRHVERFNRTVRQEWLQMNEFTSIHQAQDKAEHWLWTYNHVRPNMALGGLTPSQKLKQFNQGVVYS